MRGEERRGEEEKRGEEKRGEERRREKYYIPPGAGVTKAFGTSPALSSGTPITAASIIPG